MHSRHPSLHVPIDTGISRSAGMLSSKVMARAKTHDTLNRRHRERRTSTGKRISPQPRDLLWFQLIHRHGPLSSSCLHAFSQHICRSEKRARDRLTDLFNEDRTPHGGPYLERPWQQFDTYDARYQELVYELAPAAELALKQAGLWSSHAQHPTGPWKHRYMVSCITASIELAAVADPTLKFIPQEQILDRAGTALRYPVPFNNPITNKMETKDLIPDALFGLAYTSGSQTNYRFFVVEADRGTEPSRSSRFNRKSHLRNFLQYREYVGRGIYKDHLGLTAGMMVLNVTMSEATTRNMLELVGEIAPKGNSYLLFQTWRAFAGYFRPVRQNMSLISEAWLRSGFADFRINAAGS
jgi:hypothetical protein